MLEKPLISYAQNGEDVVLWRALGGVRGGVYVDVGGWDPDVDSVTRLFYDRGWRGVDVEPVPELAEKFRDRRSNDEVFQVVVSDSAEDSVTLHQFGSTGLSTIDGDVADGHEGAGLEHTDILVPSRRLDDVLTDSSVVSDTIHFLKVDVEGAEERVLASVDLERWRPWVLVVEATRPNSTEASHEAWEPIVLAAGYTLTLFDGLSRFYVSPDHPELVGLLSYPACALDPFERAREVELRDTVELMEEELRESRGQALRWRKEAVGYWANAIASVQRSEDEATQSRNDASRLRTQLTRARDRLQQARDDRRRLRARVQRLTARLEEAQLGQASGGALGRIRAGVKKVTGS